MDMTTELSKEFDNTMIVPLPSSHLPDELSTLNMYGMQIKVAIHKMMMEHATSKSGMNPNDISGDVFGAMKGKEAFYGHVVSRRDADTDSLVGAIGCASEIVLAVPSQTVEMNTVNDGGQPLFTADGDDGGGGDGVSLGDNTEDEPMTVLAKGCFRFVVKEVTQTFPYPIAIVDELLDNPPGSSSSSSSAVVQEVVQSKDNEDEFDSDDDDDDDDDYDDMYAHLTPSELVPRTLSAMKAITDQKINKKPMNLSPLERSILESQQGNGNNMSPDLMQGMANTMAQNQAEEMGAVFDIFVSSLIDIAPMPVDRYYAVALMAAELADVDNAARKQILTMVDGVERLRFVLEKLEETISLGQAKKLTEDIVDKSDEGSKDLKIGEPTLPNWAKSITKGVEVEYFWSEQDGWCKGTVVEEPMKIVDELIITILFEDGETHRVPFRGDEKARWRPAS